MLNGLKIGVVIPAAGKGTRMNVPESKQFLDLAGKPVIAHTLERFQSSSDVDVIIPVTDEENLERLRKIIKAFAFSKVTDVVLGGAMRQDSVWQGLLTLERHNADIVIIHDAVRPFVSQSIIHESVIAAIENGAAIVAVHPKDTVKYSEDNRIVRQTLNRDTLWLIQTPQVFRYSLLRKAYHQAFTDQFYGTDDASIVERLDVCVQIIEGTYGNIKITTPEDLDIARWFVLKNVTDAT
jgi:2-C-methyl-D-erythritol 4-phosphate cytidylyltransferase